MTISELITAMRTDLGDADSVLFADMALERCLIRAIYPVRQDTGAALLPLHGEIVPAPDGLVAELLLLLAESYACGIMRGKTANAGQRLLGRQAHRADEPGQILGRVGKRSAGASTGSA